MYTKRRYGYWMTINWSSRGLVFGAAEGFELKNFINALYEGQDKSERIENLPFPRQYAFKCSNKTT